MNHLNINNQIYPLLDYSINDRLNEGLSGAAALQADDPSILAALADNITADFEGRSIPLKVTAASYDFKANMVQLNFVDSVQYTLNHSAPVASAVADIQAKLLLTAQDLRPLFGVNAVFATDFHCVPSALPVDNTANIINSICQNYGFYYTCDENGLRVFYEGQPAPSADIIERTDSINNEKITYSGCIGTKTSMASKQKFKAGSYTPSGSEEQRENEENKTRTGLNWSNLYDLTGFIEWPNVPAAAQGTEPAPKMSRELCLSAQKPFEIELVYYRQTPFSKRGGGDPDTQTGAEPNNSQLKIVEIYFDPSNDTFLRLFPVFGTIEFTENMVYFEENRSRTYFFNYACFFDVQDTEISVKCFDKLNDEYPYRWAKDVTGNIQGRIISAMFAKLMCNSSIEGHNNITPPDFIAPKSYYIKRFTDTIIDPNSAPSTLVYIDNKINVVAGSFPWNFLTRTLNASDEVSYSVTDAAAADFVAPASNCTLSGTLPQKLQIGQAKFTHDFNLYDPDDPSILYNSEVASAAESSATFNPNMSIQDTNAPGNLYYFTAAPFYYLYDTETGADLPVWNKTFNYSNYNPQTGQEETGRAHIGSIAALNAFGLYENPQTPPQIFLPVIKYSLTKQKNLPVTINTEKIAAGIQQTESLQTFRPTVIGEGIYTTNVSDIADSGILTPQNISSGYYGALKKAEQKNTVATMSAGDISEYTVTAAKDYQLGQICSVGTNTGEVFSIASNLWYNNTAEIQAILNRILTIKNRGKSQVKLSFLLNLAIKAGQVIDNYIITSVSHTAQNRLTTITAEGL